MKFIFAWHSSRLDYDNIDNTLLLPNHLSVLYYTSLLHNNWNNWNLSNDFDWNVFSIKPIPVFLNWEKENNVAVKEYIKEFPGIKGLILDKMFLSYRFVEFSG